MSPNRASPSVRARPTARALALVAVAWLGGFAALAVFLSMLAEVGAALEAWAIAVGACGAVAHFTLLQFQWFRRMQTGQVWAVWLSAMALLLASSLAYELSTSSVRSAPMAASGVVTICLFAAVPILLVSFATTVLLQRAEA